MEIFISSKQGDGREGFTVMGQSLFCLLGTEDTVASPLGITGPLGPLSQRASNNSSTDLAWKNQGASHPRWTSALVLFSDL